mmetsp:Transcript_57273/g.153049  ORF Transcript_57273/g.153049 Transcript_57273/m.153049 type:complete len:444 (-) Transcript_57273:51-1382(-)
MVSAAIAGLIRFSVAPRWGSSSKAGRISMSKVRADPPSIRMARRQSVVPLAISSSAVCCCLRSAKSRVYASCRAVTTDCRSSAARPALPSLRLSTAASCNALNFGIVILLWLSAKYSISLRRRSFISTATAVCAALWPETSKGSCPDIRLATAIASTIDSNRFGSTAGRQTKVSLIKSSAVALSASGTGRDLQDVSRARTGSRAHCASSDFGISQDAGRATPDGLGSGGLMGFGGPAMDWQSFAMTSLKFSFSSFCRPNIPFVTLVSSPTRGALLRSSGFNTIKWSALFTNSLPPELCRRIISPSNGVLSEASTLKLLCEANISYVACPHSAIDPLPSATSTSANASPCSLPTSGSQGLPMPRDTSSNSAPTPTSALPARMHRQVVRVSKLLDTSIKGGIFSCTVCRRDSGEKKEPCEPKAIILNDTGPEHIASTTAFRFAIR